MISPDDGDGGDDSGPRHSVSSLASLRTKAGGSAARVDNNSNIMRNQSRSLSSSFTLLLPDHSTLLLFYLFLNLRAPPKLRSPTSINRRSRPTVGKPFSKRARMLAFVLVQRVNCPFPSPLTKRGKNSNGYTLLYTLLHIHIQCASELHDGV